MFLTIKEIKKICKELKITDYTINDDRSIDVNGNVNLSYMHKKIPVQFNKVTGDFICSYILDFTSLLGCPKFVGGDFSCSSTKLTTFQYAPLEVGGNFTFYGVDIKSLKYAPKVGGQVRCSSDLDIRGLIIEYGVIKNYNDYMLLLNRKLKLKKLLK
jgi:hypothetical protein